MLCLGDRVCLFLAQMLTVPGQLLALIGKSPSGLAKSVDIAGECRFSIGEEFGVMVQFFGAAIEFHAPGGDLLFCLALFCLPFGAEPLECRTFLGELSGSLVEFGRAGSQFFSPAA